MAKQSGNEISKILDRIQGHDTYTVIRDFFEISAIAIRNNVDHGKERDAYEQRYLAIVKKYRKEDLNVFAEALGVFMGWIQKAMDGDIPFRDFAGEIYMDSGNANGAGAAARAENGPGCGRSARGRGTCTLCGCKRSIFTFLTN